MQIENARPEDAAELVPLMDQLVDTPAELSLVEQNAGPHPGGSGVSSAGCPRTRTYPGHDDGHLCYDLHGRCEPFMVVENVVTAASARGKGRSARLDGRAGRIARAHHCTCMMLCSGQERTGARGVPQDGLFRYHYQGFKENAVRCFGAPASRRAVFSLDSHTMAGCILILGSKYPPRRTINPMLKIGDFSRLSRMSVRMLRHYDELGLLTPLHTDPASGYRYYSPAQLSRASRIRAFRDMGFGLQTSACSCSRATTRTRSGPSSRPARCAQTQLETTRRQLRLLEGALSQLRRMIFLCSTT